MSVKYYQNNIEITWYLEEHGEPPMSERFFNIEVRRDGRWPEDARLKQQDRDYLLNQGISKS